ncbi:MAG TPA: hypothetical protein VIW78_07370, partial [Burkholderiales bacterium]
SAGLVAEVYGVNIHAQTPIDGRDRKRLERLCRLCGPPHKRHYADRFVMRSLASLRDEQR